MPNDKPGQNPFSKQGPKKPFSSVDSMVDTIVKKKEIADQNKGRLSESERTVQKEFTEKIEKARQKDPKFRKVQFSIYVPENVLKSFDESVQRDRARRLLNNEKDTSRNEMIVEAIQEYTKTLKERNNG